MVTTPSAHPEIPARASQELGFPVQMQSLDSRTIVHRALHSPACYDLVQLEYWMVKQVLPAGVLQGIPISELRRFADLLPLFTEGKVMSRPVSPQGTAPHSVQFLASRDSRAFASGPTGFLSLAPTICNSDTLGWRPDRAPREVHSWADLLSAEFRGRVALTNIPSVSVVEAALACEALGLVRYNDKGDLSRGEIDATLAVLGEAQRSGQFHGLWRRYEESVDFMTDGPVVLQSLWPPAVSALHARGVPLRYRPLREGARGWAGGFALAAHLQGQRRAAAIEYINWYQSGWAGAYFTRLGYYSAVPATARSHLSADEWAYWYEGVAAAQRVVSPAGQPVAPAGTSRDGGSYEERMGQIACWSSQMAEHAYLQSRWQEFAASMGSLTDHLPQVAR